MRGCRDPPYTAPVQPVEGLHHPNSPELSGRGHRVALPLVQKRLRAFTFARRFQRRVRIFAPSMKVTTSMVVSVRQQTIGFPCFAAAITITGLRRCACRGLGWRVVRPEQRPPLAIGPHAVETSCMRECRCTCARMHARAHSRTDTCVYISACRACPKRGAWDCNREMDNFESTCFVFASPWTLKISTPFMDCKVYVIQVKVSSIGMNYRLNNACCMIKRLK